MQQPKGNSYETMARPHALRRLRLGQRPPCVVIVDAEGRIVADFEFEHSLEGWKSFAEKTSAWPNLAVAIETSQGAAVDQLLQREYTVYPVHPVAAQSYRERKAPSGTKTDHLDAWGLADALRVDGQGWKALQPMDPMTQQLRLLCRDEVASSSSAPPWSISSSRPCWNTIRRRWKPLRTGPTPSPGSSCWPFPRPQALVTAGKRRWEKFLHTHKLWRPETAEKRLKLFAQADQFKASDPIVRAKSQLAVSLCKLLCTLEQATGALSQANRGAVPRIIPTTICLAACREPKRSWPRACWRPWAAIPTATAARKSFRPSPGPRRCPISPARSTKSMSVGPATSSCATPIHLWADCFRKASAWGQTYYQQKREEGMSHACALRCLGQRLLKILFRMITDKKPYDAELHARNQQKHGSWVLKLANKPAA